MNKPIEIDKVLDKTEKTKDEPKKRRPKRVSLAKPVESTVDFTCTACGELHKPGRKCVKYKDGMASILCLWLKQREEEREGTESEAV